MQPIYQQGQCVGEGLGVREQVYRGVIRFDVIRLGRDFAPGVDLEYEGRTLRLHGWQSYIHRAEDGHRSTVIEFAECQIIGPDGDLALSVVSNWASIFLRLHGRAGGEIKAAICADEALADGDMELYRMWLSVLAALDVIAKLPWPAVPASPAPP